MVLILMRGPNLAIWPFYWLLELKGVLPPSHFSKEKFPKVYAWVDRFSKAVSTAKSTAPEPTTLNGAEAVKYVTQAEFSEPGTHISPFFHQKLAPRNISGPNSHYS